MIINSLSDFILGKKNIDNLKMLTSPKKVAILGAGIMGIAALRRLSEDEKFQMVCFERNYDVGGLWLYTDQTKKTDFGKPVTSAVYSNLR